MGEDRCHRLKTEKLEKAGYCRRECAEGAEQKGMNLDQGASAPLGNGVGVACQSQGSCCALQSG